MYAYLCKLYISAKLTTNTQCKKNFYLFKLFDVLILLVMKASKVVRSVRV